MGLWTILEPKTDDADKKKKPGLICFSRQKHIAGTYQKSFKGKDMWVVKEQNIVTSTLIILEILCL